MGDGAAWRLADQPRIFRKRACPMSRRPRLPGLPPRREFTVVDQEIHAARGGIDPDAVAFAHQRQRATDEGFLRDVADAHATRRSGKTPVGDEGDLLAHSLSVDQRGDAEHLAHAGAADRALVADHENVAGGVFAIAHGIDAVLLVLEYTGGAGSQFVLLQSASVSASLSSWIRAQTNNITPSSFTVSMGSGTQMFYRIKSE